MNDEIETPEDLVAAIEAMGGDDGWYKSSSGETYQELGSLLLGRGFTPQEAFSLLESAHGATVECYT